MGNSKLKNIGHHSSQTKLGSTANIQKARTAGKEQKALALLAEQSGDPKKIQRYSQKGKRESTKEWQNKFIRVLRAGHNVSRACQAAGVTRNWAYHCKNEDEGFRVRWENAWEVGIDELEEEAHRRAMDGSDMLLMFMLNGNRGQKYRKGVVVEDSDGLPLSFSINIARAKEPDLIPEQQLPYEDAIDADFREVEADE